jgi:hypothetical protein
MKPKSVRVGVDLPVNLHQRLRQEARRKGCSACELIVAAIEQAFTPTQLKKGRLTLEQGLVRRTGKPISVTNDEIYELGFP